MANSVKTVFQSLEIIASQLTAFGILHRYHLICFRRHANLISRCGHAIRASQDHFGRNETLVMNHLIKEAWPYLDRG